MTWTPQHGERCWIEAEVTYDANNELAIRCEPFPGFIGLEDNQPILPKDIVDVLEAMTMQVAADWCCGNIDGVFYRSPYYRSLNAALDCLVKCGRLERLGEDKYKRIQK